MRAWVAVLVLLVLTTPILSGPLSSQCSAETGTSSVRPLIYEVCPAKPEEFVTVVNAGCSELNASRLKLTDGEGTLTLPSITLGPGDTLTVSKDPAGPHDPMNGTYFFSYIDLNITRKGLFALADDGDQVTLLLDNLFADSFCYGSALAPEGWKGDPFKFLDKGHMAVHSFSGTGERSKNEWTSGVMGRALFDPYNVSLAEVVPVFHPEDGNSPLLRMISTSLSSIKVSVYTLEDPEIACALAKASENGVDVDVLVEGQPVGGLTAYGKRAIVTMLESGVDVKEFRSNGTYRRYEYIHAKYAVFDSKSVSISSENWGGGLSSNRGWGAVIRSEELANYLENVFLTDSDKTFGDVQTASAYDAEPFSDYDLTTYPVMGECTSAGVTVVISPDRSLAPIRSMIQNAEERICIEEMSMDMDWMEQSGLLGDILDAARSGVEIKILLDRANQYDENMAAASRLLKEAEGLPIECKLASAYHDFATIHNKGIIVDDQVLISSINLVSYAFNENREMGVIVDSDVVSDILFDRFMSDWLDDMESPTVVVSSDLIDCVEGDGIMLDASGSYDNSAVTNYTWDIGNDGIADGYGPLFSFEPAAGETEVMLTIRDGYGNSASENITVLAAPKGEVPLSDLLLAAPAAAIGSILAIRAIRKRIKSNQ